METTPGGKGKRLGGFPERLAWHLHRCGMLQQDLARSSGIPEPIISEWINNKDRRVGQEQIGRLAFALAARYAEIRAAKEPGAAVDLSKGVQRSRHSKRVDSRSGARFEVGPSYRGPEDLVALVEDLLASAGHQLRDGNRDLVWRRMAGSPEPHVLRVGWYEKYPLIYTHGQGMRGIAKSVTERVCSLLAARIDWVRLDLSEITERLLTGDIDMVCCEYVGVESIGFQVWLSDPLPMLRVGPVGLVERNRLGRATARERDEGGETLVWPRFNELRFNHTNTLIGKALLSALIPTAAVDSPWNVPEGRKPIPVGGTLLECCEDLVQAPEDERGRVRCFATDSLTYLEAKRSLGDALAPLPVTPREPLPLFGLCFALHPSEGGRLGQLLNRTLSKLSEMRFFEFLFEAPEWIDTIQEHAELLDQMRAASSADRQGPTTATGPGSTIQSRGRQLFARQPLTPESS